MEIDFHPLYSRTAGSWSLLQLEPGCEESLRSGGQLWLKGTKDREDMQEVPTVVCTESETFHIRREKSSNMSYLALKSEPSEDGKQSDENASRDENGGLGRLSVIGVSNSVMVMTKTPPVMSNLEDYMASHRGLTNNSNSEMTFKKLFSMSQISLLELYSYLFDYSSMVYCDVEGCWYSINNDVLLFLLSSILQRGMSLNISFRDLRIRDVKSLLREHLSELEAGGASSTNTVCYNTLKHALSFDLALVQLVKHLVNVPTSNDLAGVILVDFDKSNVRRLLDSPRIQDCVGLRNIDDVKVDLSYKRIQGILALSILRKHQVLKVGEYVEELQSAISDYIPLELSELEFQSAGPGADSDPDCECTATPTDLYFGFPLMENHPDNIGVRFDIIAGHAYYNQDDDTIIYLPSSTLPVDPRSRLSSLFSKKKYWHISELDAYISPVLQQNIKLGAFCLKNCYVCERRIFDQNFKLFYNKNLPIMQ
ncbi:hypothetical protein OIY81_213 [Cryptosporidium canis]|nr:hypothetical protein OIY81_213 [Cryptosporidium canis]